MEQTHPSQEAQKLADDLANCIECIEQNSIDGGPINDTIWFSGAVTLVDELHRIMERIRTQPVNQQPDTAALLNLLADIRAACGDNGKRMQDELVEYIRAGFAELARGGEPATIEDNSQNWAGMDGATAWHLIDRHADGWGDIAKMMHEWLEANIAARLSQQEAGWRRMETAPMNTPILVTDGKVMVVVKRGEWAGEDWPEEVGFGGYEWEFDFEWKDLKGWQPLPAPPTQQGE